MPLNRTVVDALFSVAACASAASSVGQRSSDPHLVPGADESTCSVTSAGSAAIVQSTRHDESATIVHLRLGSQLMEVSPRVSQPLHTVGAPIPIPDGTSTVLT